MRPVASSNIDIVSVKAKNLVSTFKEPFDNVIDIDVNVAHG